VLDFPFPEPPPPGEWRAVAPGLLWARLPLPFRLDHVNVYALADGDGWVLFDAGIADDATRALWDRLLPALGPVRALIVSHNDPDHVGLAGWLCDRLAVPLWTSRATFLSATAYVHAPGLLEAEEYTRFYASHGMGEEVAALVSTRGHRYLRMMSRPPRSYRRLAPGMVLRLGGRDWTVLTGEGHAPEQVMLHAPAEGLLLAADQILERISPNVSAGAFEPEGDPLGDYLASLDRLEGQVDGASLVLAGHRLPFTGLPERAAALRVHHAARCDLILSACADGPRSAAELLPVLFPQALDAHQTAFAFGETLAHVARLVAEGRLVWEERDGLRRVRPAASEPPALLRRAGRA
jgi:glyoxylase-like metal-dependent hydrolase (beta-lactamase superfamily II)